MEFNILNLQIKDAKFAIADLTITMENELDEVAVIAYDNDLFWMLPVLWCVYVTLH